MKKSGGGFGFLMLVVVVAIVLYLASKNLESTVPHGRIEKDEPAAGAGIVLDEGSPNSGESVPARPDLSNMKSATDTHTSDVNRSLGEAQ